MKKLIAILVFLSLSLNFFVFWSFAQSNDGADNNQIENVGAITLCEYEPQKKSIHICGNIYNDRLIQYNSYSLGLYKIPLGSDIAKLLDDPHLKPIATSEISINFDFLIYVSDIEDRFCEYAVMLFNEDGNIVPIADPKFPLAKNSYSFEKDSKDAYKGISSELVSLVSSALPALSVITVDTDRLLSDSSVGYLYSNKNTYLYFDKEYVEELDKKINPLLALGTDVYLRFQFKFSDQTKLVPIIPVNKSVNFIPDMSVDRNRELMRSFVDFLTDRYSSRYLGNISGIILGREIDKTYLLNTSVSVENYAQNYAYLTYLVSETARENITDIDISIPFSDTNTYFNANADGISCAPSQLLEYICSWFDRSFVSDLAFSTHITSSAVPYNISDETIISGDFSDDVYAGISADRVHEYEDYLVSLYTQYKNTPENYIFEWSLPPDISENVLSCAYAYSYMHLLSNTRLSSFVISFEDCERAGDYSNMEYLFEILKRIDTKDAQRYTDSQRTMLRIDSWNDVIKDSYGGTVDHNRYFDMYTLNSLPSSVIGAFDYFNYAETTDISQWYMGTSCETVKLEHSTLLGKSLRARFTGSTISPAEYSEICYAYEFGESLKFTKYLAVNLSIDNGNNDTGDIYEIQITFGAPDAMVQKSAVIKEAEAHTLLFDISSFNNDLTVSYIKIGIRPLSANDSPFVLSLSSIRGYSEQYTNEDLISLIQQERLRIQNLQSPSSEGSGNDNTLQIALIILGVLLACGIGVFFSVRREDTNEEENGG